MNQSERRVYLIKRLLNEKSEYSGINISKNSQEQKAMLRSLMNIRMPGVADKEFLEIQDEYLKQTNMDKGIVTIEKMEQMKEDIFLWQGDITRLKVGAIVNAANSGMTGCYQPCHNCIDNCIHTYAGIQLRNYCNNVMEKQGHEEPIGSAKITPAFNLPCEYIIHTVGPIVMGKLTEKQRKQLESCYKSCLNIAEDNNVKSIAFCCISTGVFGFPNDIAAKIAVETVIDYKKKNNSEIKVIFNVFKEEDRRLYEEIFRRK